MAADIAINHTRPFSPHNVRAISWQVAWPAVGSFVAASSLQALEQKSQKKPAVFIRLDSFCGCLLRTVRCLGFWHLHVGSHTHHWIHCSCVFSCDKVVSSNITCTMFYSHRPWKPRYLNEENKQRMVFPQPTWHWRHCALTHARHTALGVSMLETICQHVGSSTSSPDFHDDTQYMLKYVFDWIAFFMVSVLSDSLTSKMPIRHGVCACSCLHVAGCS